MNAVDDPVHIAQRTFRALLAALAHPGRVTAIDERVNAPSHLGSALGASAVALFDREVTVWVGPAHRNAIGGWLVERTSCRLVTEPRDAQFAVILDIEDALPLERWNAGTPEDPEASATLLVRIAGCSGGGRVMLAGPGIEHHVAFEGRDIPQRFWLNWRVNASLYPLGVDCFFFDDCRVVGLPRTTLETIEMLP